MPRNWTCLPPSESGWYFFKCQAYAEQLAWVDHSSGKWFAVVRHNIPLNIDGLSNAEFDGPLLDPGLLVNQETLGTMEAALAQLGLVESELQ